MTAWADMTREEQLADAAARAEAECIEQGVPFLVDDPVVLDRCARIITTPGAFENEEHGSAA